MDNLIDFITIVISLIALGCSIYIWKKTDNTQKLMNNVNLESVIYLEIFKDFLIKTIPTARNEIYIDIDGKICEYTKLIDVLIDLKKQAIYFNYRYLSFYEELVLKANEIENIIVEATSKKFVSIEKEKKLKEIDDKIMQLYEHIIKGYFGDL